MIKSSNFAPVMPNIIIGTRNTAKIEQKQRLRDVFGYFRLRKKRKRKKELKNNTFIGLKQLVNNNGR
jgi:hypothetical protein